MIKTGIIIASICGLSNCTLNPDNNSIPFDSNPDRYTLVWSDEFDKDGLPDPARWSYDKGDGCPQLCGWGNNEQEFYTEKEVKNARIENGHLIIEAHKELIETRNYSSARLVTRGKGDWTYGKIEVRSKNPSGKGTWPAIWMLPSDNTYGGWPSSGEIDIMEHVGYAADSIFSTVHTDSYNHLKGTQKGGHKVVMDSEVAFHTYGIIWNEQKIDFTIDDDTIFTFENEQMTSEEWPFDQDFHLILNLAVGGHWGGKYGIDEEIWPQQMVVDYVRVYKQNNERTF